MNGEQLSAKMRIFSGKAGKIAIRLAAFGHDLPQVPFRILTPSSFLLHPPSPSVLDMRRPRQTANDHQVKSKEISERDQSFSVLTFVLSVGTG